MTPCVRRFLDDGFVKIEGAFPRALADEGRAILWRDTGFDPNDPATWTSPVVRLGDYAQEPFRRAANTPILHDAFDTLAGRGRWTPRGSLGTFPIRFPSPYDPGDAGWHVEASFAGDDGSYRTNVFSKGRALLMLFLFSDVAEDAAPTRIRVGSHVDVPRLLEPHGDAGLSYLELGALLDVTASCPMVLATGRAGDVYLCHPFLVHAAQPHRGTRPRFIAQPPLLPAEPIALERADAAYSPVELAIRRGLGRS